MEQENKQDQFEINFDDNSNVIEINEGKRHSHHHSSHSHHSSHKHHKKYRSSRDKKEKKSLWKRIRSLFTNKNRKPGSAASITFLIFAVILVIGLVIYVKIDIQNSLSSGEYQDGTISNENGYGEQIPDNSNVQTVPSVPSYWEKMIEKKTDTVKKLQSAGGKDCISFAWASDTHIPDNSTAKTDNIGKVMAKMMDNCEIPFAILTGDIGTRSSLDTEQELLKSHKMIPVHLSPLWGTNRLLVALGNHDGCYGDSSGYYQKKLPPEKMWDFYFRGQALDSRRVFSDDGTYFYVDNQSQKIRYIVLNSQFGGEYLMNSSGVVVNDNFAISCYGQKQLDWLSDVALDMPEGYGAVIAAHVPPNIEYTSDKAQLVGILDAYNNKGTYSGSYTEGIDGWTNSEISVDFSNAKGEVIAMFTGHVHGDSIDTETLSCPLITIISAGADENDWYDKAEKSPKRTPNTDTETSFDIVTINRKARTIYCTRVGAGEDRKLKY